ncbi:hypothetical protein AAMO2058_000841800 [Amorphochlora amoebiformis]
MHVIYNTFAKHTHTNPPKHKHKQIYPRIQPQLRLTQGKDHPAVAVAMRTVALLTLSRECHNPDGDDKARSLLEQARNMWERMYEGSYKARLEKRLRETLVPQQRLDGHIVIDGLLTEKDCAEIISLSRSRESYVRARVLRKQREEYDEDPDEVPPPDEGKYTAAGPTMLKLYENFVLTRLAYSLSLLSGVPFSRISDAEITRFCAGEGTELSEKGGGGRIYTLQGRQDLPVINLVVFLTDDYAGGDIHFPYLDNTVVKPKVGRAILFTSRDEKHPNKLWDGAIYRHIEVGSDSKSEKWVLNMDVGPTGFENWVNFGGVATLLCDESEFEPFNL